jgi:predicted Fe-Mo cluster-binding NifX family protein
MTVAIASNKDNTNASVDLHFGRCNWFCLFDTQTREYSFIRNQGAKEAKAGWIAAGLLITRKIDLVVAGRFGSNVIDTFRKNRVTMVIPGQQRTINEIFNLIKQ